MIENIYSVFKFVITTLISGLHYIKNIFPYSRAYWPGSITQLKTNKIFFNLQLTKKDGGE